MLIRSFKTQFPTHLALIVLNFSAAAFFIPLIVLPCVLKVKRRERKVGI